MIYFFSYYLAGLALLLLAMPLGFALFADRGDRGWAGARLLGLILAALAHRMAGVLELPPWSAAALLLPGVPVLVAWCGWTLHNRGTLQRWLGAHWRSIAGIELVFLGAYAGAALLCAHDPAPFGTERLMDMALLQAVSSAPTLPPADPWLSGETLNYYWLGHHMAALPGRLAGVPVSVTYNLALAYGFATLVQLACAILLPAAGSLRRALLGGAMVGLAGNLFALFQAPQGSTYANLHFAASRIIPHTITEFPLLSLLVGDLHAHLLLLPVLLLFILWLQVRPRDHTARLTAIAVINVLFLATLWGNPWNLAALLALFAAGKVLRCTSLPWWTPAPALLALPALWPVQGQGVALAWVTSARTSPLLAFGQMWAIPLLLTLGLVDWRLARARLFRYWGLLWVLPPLGLALHSPAAGICLALALLLWRAHRRGEAQWASIGIAGLVLISAPELFYVRDAYAPPFERMNTVFKLSYAAWPLLLLAAARATLLLVDTGRERLRHLAAGVAAIALAGLCIYGAMAIPQRLAKTLPRPLWDGIAALAKDHPQDIALIRWLTPRLQPHQVCLEAPGVSYQWSGRVSALTGCATVLGWEDHQRLWRGAGSDLAQRHDDAERLYLTTNPQEQMTLLARYHIDWVIVGEVELARYGAWHPALPVSSVAPVYAAGPVRIYRINKNRDYLAP